MQKPSLSNLRKNWWFVLSATAFFVLGIGRDSLILGCISAIFAVPFAIFIAAIEKSILNRVTNNKKALLFLSSLSAISVSLGNNPVFLFSAFNNLLQSTQDKFNILIPSTFISFYLIPILLRLLCLPFCFALLSEAYKFIWHIFEYIIPSVTKKDFLITALFYLFLLCLTAVAFSKTGLLFGVPNQTDILYTSDINLLLNGNCYISVGHNANDIRQPLFAVFSAPFFAPIYLLERILPLTKSFSVFFTMAMNTALMSLSFLLISLSVTNECKKRAGLLLLLFCMYATLLFSMVIEQYQVVIFWLSAYFFYCTKEKNTSITKKVLYIATSGTLATNIVTFPLMLSEKNMKKSLILFRNIVCMGLLTLCFSGRLVVLLSAYDRITYLTRYSGGNFTFITKLFRFLSFVPHCFIAPNAYIENRRWILGEATTSAVILGAVIFSACITSFIINRKLLFAKISFLWTIYSFVILCLIGWGVPENGSVLYSLYFGWAYCVLIHLLITSAFERFKLKNGALITEIFIAAVMLLYNIPKIMEMLNQLSIYYPA